MNPVALDELELGLIAAVALDRENALAPAYRLFVIGDHRHSIRWHEGYIGPYCGLPA